MEQKDPLWCPKFLLTDAVKLPSSPRFGASHYLFEGLTLLTPGPFLCIPMTSPLIQAGGRHAGTRDGPSRSSLLHFKEP